MTERDQMRADLKRRLNSYRDLCAERAQLMEEMRRLEGRLCAPCGPSMDGMPRSPGASNAVERGVVKLLSLQERYRHQVELLTDAQIQIEDLIEGLEPTERRLARFRYIDGLTWEEICGRLCYSWRQTHRIHGRMLDKLLTAEIERGGAEE